MDEEETAKLVAAILAVTVWFYFVYRVVDGYKNYTESTSIALAMGTAFLFFSVFGSLNDGDGAQRKLVF